MTIFFFLEQGLIYYILPNIKRIYLIKQSYYGFNHHFSSFPPPAIPPTAKATIYLSVRWLLFETSTFISDDNLEK